MKHKHLVIEDRDNIEKLLKENANFVAIAKHIGKDASSISKEIRKNYTKQIPSRI